MQILDLARRDALKIDVGKSPNYGKLNAKQIKKQEQNFINDHMLK